MERDVTTHFKCFSPLEYKIMHESFMISKGISWRNIDFDKSYVRFYKRRQQKEKFDLLEHVNEVKFKDYFRCRCKKNYEFHGYLWQYDTRHDNNYCPFKMRCHYFQLLQSVDKNINSSEKLVRLSSKGSLMRMKRYLSRFKPDYEIWFWIKSFNNTCS